MALSGGLQRAATIETAHLEAYVMKTYGLINQAHFLESPERVTEQREKFYWYLEAGVLGLDFIFGHFIQTTPESPASKPPLAAPATPCPVARAARPPRCPPPAPPPAGTPTPTPTRPPSPLSTLIPTHDTSNVSIAFPNRARARKGVA